VVASIRSASQSLDGPPDGSLPALVTVPVGGGGTDVLAMGGQTRPTEHRAHRLLERAQCVGDLAHQLEQELLDVDRVRGSPARVAVEQASSDGLEHRASDVAGVMPVGERLEGQRALSDDHADHVARPELPCQPIRDGEEPVGRGVTPVQPSVTDPPELDHARQSRVPPDRGARDQARQHREVRVHPDGRPPSLEADAVEEHRAFEGRDPVQPSAVLELDDALLVCTASSAALAGSRALVAPMRASRRPNSSMASGPSSRRILIVPWVRLERTATSGGDRRVDGSPSSHAGPYARLM